ncbi:NlpC/P60 family protein [Streptomyces sp. B6B3]|uniref:C40 family peptidase n=1 Tax=Streptomyces sp. B6B3 TaxID=3153570 RepID=UPI00325EB611
MAQHRKTSVWRRPAQRKPKPVGSAKPALRSVAATLTLAGAAAAALDGSALADPQPTLAEVRERVDALHREAEEATERFNAATEQVEQAETALDRLRDEAARRTDELNTSRNALGTHAAAQYRASGLAPELQLALSSDPDDFLYRASLVDRTGERQALAVQDIRGQLRGIEQLRTEAGEETDVLLDAQERADTERDTVRDKLAEAEDLLATRTAEEQQRILMANATASTAAGVPGAAEASAAAPNARAAAAVAFAFAQLGKAYGWGATGPDAYDCSGLTQAAWAAAGVALPRTSYSQVSAGTPVSSAELAPGDLVFYYGGISHVGIYVGGGQIIHASRSGVPITLAPVDSMPFAAATRPA